MDLPGRGFGNIREAIDHPAAQLLYDRAEHGLELRRCAGERRPQVLVKLPHRGVLVLNLVRRTGAVDQPRCAGGLDARKSSRPLFSVARAGGGDICTAVALIGRSRLGSAGIRRSGQRPSRVPLERRRGAVSATRLSPARLAAAATATLVATLTMAPHPTVPAVAVEGAPIATGAPRAAPQVRASSPQRAAICSRSCAIARLRRVRIADAERRCSVASSVAFRPSAYRATSSSRSDRSSSPRARRNWCATSAAWTRRSWGHGAGRIGRRMKRRSRGARRLASARWPIRPRLRSTLCEPCPPLVHRRRRGLGGLQQGVLDEIIGVNFRRGRDDVRASSATGGRSARPPQGRSRAVCGRRAVASPSSFHP